MTISRLNHAAPLLKLDFYIFNSISILLAVLACCVSRHLDLLHRQDFKIVARVQTKQ